MSSKNIYTPYFYIIQHKITKILYAGSRWAKNCHPDEFMQPNGYQTSSNTIKYIIKLEGLNIFDIIRIDTNLDGLSAYDYESMFLQALNCANLYNWYNSHNNIGMAFGTTSYNKLILEKYGYSHVNQSPIIQQKIINTNLIKYGYAHVTQSPITKQKTIDTNLEKYGVPFALCYPEFKIISDQSVLRNWGVTNVSKSQIIKELKTNTYIKNYGVTNPSKSDEIKLKKNDTCLKNWGYVSHLQSPEMKVQIKNTNIEKTGYDNPSKVPFLSVISNRKTYAKNILSQYYPEFKQFY
jgi:hypothetical protein